MWVLTWPAGLDRPTWRCFFFSGSTHQVVFWYVIWRSSLRSFRHLRSRGIRATLSELHTRLFTVGLVHGVFRVHGSKTCSTSVFYTDRLQATSPHTLDQEESWESATARRRRHWKEASSQGPTYHSMVDLTLRGKVIRLAERRTRCTIILAINRLEAGKSVWCDLPRWCRAWKSDWHGVQQMHYQQPASSRYFPGRA